MLMITPIKSVAQAEKYYIQRSSLETYYCDNPEFNGYWGGKGAEMLGLPQYITDEAFSRLIRNLHPLTGEQLTERMRSDRRPGFDITFSPPKPVSLAWAFTGDDRVIRAHRETTWEIRDEMEKDAAARVRARLGSKADGDRTTGNWACAEIVHLVARPEDGFPDPLIHTHLVVFNVTHDPVEKKWKALQMGNIHEEAPYYQAMYHRRLKERLEALGLKIVQAGESYTIEGIERETVEKFSRRTATIEETAARLGITDPEKKAKLGAMTRERKNKSLEIPELRALWRDYLTEDEKRVFEGIGMVLQRSRAEELSRQMVPAGLERTADALGTQQQLPTPQAMPESSDYLGSLGKSDTAERKRLRSLSMNQRTAPEAPEPEAEVAVTEHDRRAVALAMEHLFERHSVVTEKKLLGEAYSNWCVMRATREGINKVVAQEAPLLRETVDGKVLVTTPEVLAEERRIIAACKAGLGQLQPMNALWKIEDEKLTAEQREAVQHVVTTRDLITAIKGKAGTGKTILLHQAKRAIEAGFNKLMIFAPGSEAARDVLPGEGFKNAETVARLLENKELQKQAYGAVLWIDEAAQLSTRLMDQLIALTKELEARLVLVGDPGQHHSVERGCAFRALEKKGEMKVAQVEKIMRQTGTYREIVECAARMETDKAIDLMQAQGEAVELPAGEMEKLAARRYVQAVKRGETVLVVSPTHKECDRAAAAVREELKSIGKLGDSVEWEVLKNLSWTKATRRDPEKYVKGLVVQINRPVKGFMVGDQVEVIDVREGMVRVRRARDRFHDEIKALPLDRPKTFSVHERRKMEICEGEKLRVTCNGQTENRDRMYRGKWATVDYITSDGKLVLENGFRVDRGFKHLDYGYSSTSHSAQGKTVDRVIVMQSAEIPEAASAEQIYVSLSRGRRSPLFITDDLERVRENVSKKRGEILATELMADGTERVLTTDVPEEKMSNLLGMQVETPAVQSEAKCEREMDHAMEPTPEREVASVEMEMAM